MHCILLALAPLTLSACAIHIHVHEAPRASPGAAASPARNEPPLRGAVSGIVLDAQGHPVCGHVAAVGKSGSVSMGTNDDGRFELSDLSWPEFTLHANTEELIAVRTQVRPGTHGIELVLGPAATLFIGLEGTQDIRCAILHDKARVEDFTLRAGTSVRVVVPPGEILVQLYDGAGVRAEQKVRTQVGEPARLGFGPIEERPREDS